jgi:hypothetical protein
MSDEEQTRLLVPLGVTPHNTQMQSPVRAAGALVSLWSDAVRPGRHRWTWAA